MNESSISFYTSKTFIALTKSLDTNYKRSCRGQSVAKIKDEAAKKRLIEVSVISTILAKSCAELFDKEEDIDLFCNHVATSMKEMWDQKQGEGNCLS